MNYELPYFCPILSPRYCLSSFLCPCLVSSILYSKIFNNNKSNILGFLLCPLVAYGSRRFVINKLNIKESYKKSAFKSFCFCFSFVQDIHEMRVRKIGLFKYYEEPDYVVV